MPAYIIVDLGFGDSGKGLLTDSLVRQSKAGVVVRYNGGAQAGHNVVTPDGRHHTFSQFGAGTFTPGVRTFLSRHVVVHPSALLAEGDVLAGKGLADVFSRLRISEQALLITPFHQGANRIREIVRGKDRHGSCGVGVGEAVEDARNHPEDRLLAGDLSRPAVLRRKLQHIRERKRDELVEFCRNHPPRSRLEREWRIFEQDDIIQTWLDSIERIGSLGLVAPDETLEKWLHETGNVVFEGAQGILLDAEAGFHPYTTWANCTAENALDLISELAPGCEAFKIGVIRTYAVRHGPGPLPTETGDLTSLISEHNQNNEWQGDVRYGWFDAVLTRYALGVAGGLDALALTHLDILPRLETWKYCPGYPRRQGLDKYSRSSQPAEDIMESLSIPRERTLARRSQFTHELTRVTPVLETCAADEGSVTGKIESLLGRAVDMISRGPCAGDVQLLHSLPV